jgi:hypothetical protein
MQYLTFNEAFDRFILNQKTIGWGFQHETKVMLPNGYSAFPVGYYTEFENGYKLIVSGASLGAAAIQEALILNPEGVPIARDTEDLKPYEFK